MPNRIIKESICTSENIDGLTPFEETVFIRLMVNADDFGRFDGRAKILSARLFPLKNITPEEMTDALKSLVNADLVTVYEVDGKPYVHLNSWEKHQQTRASKSKYPAPSESTCNHLIADDSKCPRNRIRIRNTINDNRNRNTEDDNAAETGFRSDDEAKGIQSEQNRVLDAAEDAGFGKSNSVRAGLLKLYADYGLEKMLAGFESCVKHGVSNIAYLEACLKGTPKKAKGAQDYEQRDYSSVQNDVMKRQAARIAARKDASNFTQRDYSDVPGQIMTGIAEELKDFQKGAG